MFVVAVTVTVSPTLYVSDNAETLPALLSFTASVTLHHFIKTVTSLSMDEKSLSNSINVYPLLVKIGAVALP